MAYTKSIDILKKKKSRELAGVLLDFSKWMHNNNFPLKCIKQLLDFNIFFLLNKKKKLIRNLLLI